MDKITHEIRLSHWKAVIEQCSLRPSGQTVKQGLVDNGINEKTCYYWQRRGRKDVSGQINLPQTAESQEPISVSFAEIPVIPEQRETASELLSTQMQLSGQETLLSAYPTAYPIICLKE